jgi:hypothetical protein
LPEVTGYGLDVLCPEIQYQATANQSHTEGYPQATCCKHTKENNEDFGYGREFHGIPCSFSLFAFMPCF